MALSSLQLYSAPFSGCTARVRIAAYLKKIPDVVPLTINQINVIKKETQTAEYRAKNPNGSVPTLIAHYDGSAGSQ